MNIKEKLAKIKRPNVNRYWVWLGGGLFCVLMVFVLGAYWFAHPDNKFVGVLVAIMAVVGFIIIRRQIKNRHDIKAHEVAVNIADSDVKGVAKVKRNGAQPNSLNIYGVKYEDKVMPLKLAFENVYNPEGQPQHCLNDNKDYFVHIYDVSTKKLKPFMLPDSRFIDPAVMATFLEQPAQTKYLRHRETLMKYIGPGLLLVANVGAFITIIAMSGG